MWFFLVLAIVFFLISLTPVYTMVLGFNALVFKYYEVKGDSTWTRELAVSLFTTSLAIILVFLALAIWMLVIFIKKYKKEKQKSLEKID